MEKFSTLSNPSYLHAGFPFRVCKVSTFFFILVTSYDSHIIVTSLNGYVTVSVKPTYHQYIRQSNDNVAAQQEQKCMSHKTGNNTRNCSLKFSESELSQKGEGTKAIYRELREQMYPSSVATGNSV